MNCLTYHEKNVRLVAFLYVLMRDHLTPGKVEEIITKFIEPTGNNVASFSNEYLAQYAAELADRMAEIK